MIGLKSAAELAADKPHGTRIKYVGGCRCTPCRAANSNYNCERARLQRLGLGNPLVDATPAREHLFALSERGIGYKTVADCSGIAASVVFKIRSGQRRQIRRKTSDAILAVTFDAVNDATLIDGAPTWKRIKWLLSEGFTEADLAARLGYQTPKIQIHRDRVRAKTAAKVERFYNMIRLGE